MEKTLFALFMLACAVFLSGCDAGQIRDYAQKYIGKSGEIIDKTNEVKTTVENENPVFASQEEIKTEDPISGQVSELVTKSLKSVFSDAKLLSVQNEGNTPFIMKYVTKKRIGQTEGEALYKDLLANDCRAKDNNAPRFYENRNSFEFSVYHDFGGRSYILTVVLDLGEQVVWVNVY